MCFIICINCGISKEFRGKGSYQHKFCSEKCEIEYNTINCIICNNIFITKGRHKSFYKKTCSSKCENILRSHSLTNRIFSDIHKQRISISQKKRIENGYDPSNHFNNYIKEFGSWNKGITKETDGRVKKISDVIRKTENDPLWLITIGLNKKEKLRNINDRSSWNKGLTKNNCEKIATIGKNISKAYANSSEEFKELKRKYSRITTLNRINNQPLSSRTNTKPELRFKEILKAMDINFIHNYPIWKINHMYPADFLLPDYDLIIEIDGTYWHHYPEGLLIDHIRTIELSNIGLNVLRIWDSEISMIEQNLFILKKILNFIKVYNEDMNY
jgi:very-short-patch-repair endonuclease